MYSTCEKPKFSHPFTLIAAAPTKSGKTRLVKRIVEHSSEIITPPPEQIIWCYSIFQDTYNSLLKNKLVVLHEGLPSLEGLKKSKDIPKLLILDDLMIDAAGKKNELNKLFTVYAHHLNCSCIHIVQNLFFSNLRSARINCHYLLLLRNPADKLQISTLARQLFPGNTDVLLQAYKDAVQKPYGYLLIDVSPEIDDRLRIRTNIFPDEYCTVYVPKNL